MIKYLCCYISVQKKIVNIDTTAVPVVKDILGRFQVVGYMNLHFRNYFEATNIYNYFIENLYEMRNIYLQYKSFI